ncbi:MAG: transcription antitermination factor NusB [Magnetovibrionaceae bacterium]
MTDNQTAETKAPAPKNPPKRRKRTISRLMAVQALYEISLTGASADPILRDFIQNRWSRFEVGEGDFDGLPEPDAGHLGAVVRGVLDREAELDGIIKGALAEDLSLDRMEPLLHMILRAGTYELLGKADVPPKVIVSEYADVTHSFYSDTEVALVNGLLDRLAGVLRG